jgi:AcrR family transcriptional regulator
MMLETPKRDRQTERREATRQEILTAAWAVAREQGLAQITLREVADRVGMRAPSLYSHFESKNAIYDAMFGQAWAEFLESSLAADSPRPRTARTALRRYARMFFDFAVADLARHQLMNQRTIPGFTPTDESYAPAVEVIRLLRQRVAAYGIDRDQDIDLFTAIVSGLVDQQLANDPGGDRYARLLNRAIDMYADNLGL